MFKEIGKDAIILSHNIDQPFINHLEQVESDYQFKRIDSDINDEFQEGNQEELKDENEKLSKLFKDKLTMKIFKLKC